MICFPSSLSLSRRERKKQRARRERFAFFAGSEGGSFLQIFFFFIGGLSTLCDRPDLRFISLRSVYTCPILTGQGASSHHRLTIPAGSLFPLLALALIPFTPLSPKFNLMAPFFFFLIGPTFSLLFFAFFRKILMLAQA